MKRPSFDGKIMNAPVTAAAGVINQDTIFKFSQKDDVISAEYAGGKVTKGYLIGRMLNDKFEFRYCQSDADGNLDGGHSTCDIDYTDDGRLQIIEHFEWASKEGSGVNVIEELK